MDMTRCFWCDAVVGFDAHLDHVVPRKKGGPDEPWNMVVSCRTCNASKRDMWPTEFARNRLYDRINVTWPHPDFARTSDYVLRRIAVAQQVEEHFQRWAVTSGNRTAITALEKRGRREP